MCDKCKAIAGPNHDAILAEAQAELARVRRWVFASNAVAVGAAALFASSFAAYYIYPDDSTLYGGLVQGMSMIVISMALFLKYQQIVIDHARKAVQGMTELMLNISKARMFAAVASRDEKQEEVQLN